MTYTGRAIEIITKGGYFMQAIGRNVEGYSTSRYSLIHADGSKDKELGAVIFDRLYQARKLTVISRDKREVRWGLAV